MVRVQDMDTIGRGLPSIIDAARYRACASRISDPFFVEPGNCSSQWLVIVPIPSRLGAYPSLELFILETAVGLPVRNHIQDLQSVAKAVVVTRWVNCEAVET